MSVDHKWPALAALSAVTDVRKNYDGAAEDHRPDGDAQQETEGRQKHQQTHRRSQPEVVACPAGRFGIVELPHPGGVLVLELALKIIQQVTVAVIQH
jgi:hypothetical protein